MNSSYVNFEHIYKSCVSSTCLIQSRHGIIYTVVILSVNLAILFDKVEKILLDMNLKCSPFIEKDGNDDAYDEDNS